MHKPTPLIWITCFASLMTCYHLNPHPLLGNDSRPARFSAVNLVKRGTFELNSWDRLFRDQQGQLPYYVQQTQKGYLVSRFGYGTPLMAAPFFAVSLWWHEGRIGEHHARWLGKLASSCYFALAAVLLGLTAMQLGASQPLSIILTLTYGLATAAFSVGSQALWQHGPANFFLVLMLWCMTSTFKSRFIWAGVACSGMVFCRPPTLLLAVALLLYVWQQHRQRIKNFILGGMPIALFYAWLNWFYYGAIFSIGQTRVVTGPDAVPVAAYWQTHILQNLLGLLVAPSRGLLIYSPFFIFLFWQLKKNWQAWQPLHRYSLVACLLYLLMNASYYGWYGGWTFGYRMLLDIVPLLMLLFLPVLQRLHLPQHIYPRIIFRALVVISIVIHALGAYCYDPFTWDSHPDVDAHPARLWSLKESQLGYVIQNLHWRNAE